MARIEWENFSAMIAALIFCMIERCQMPEFPFRIQSHHAQGTIANRLMHGPPAIDQNGLTRYEIAFIR